MTQREFMAALRRTLSGLPAPEVERVCQYYDEIFSDGLEAGRSEEEICAGLDSPDRISGRIRAELAFVRAEQSPGIKNTNTALLVVLGLLALPIGLPLAIAVVALLFAAGAVMLSLIVSAIAVALALLVSGVALLAGSVWTFAAGGWPAGLGLLGASLLCLGLTFLEVSLCLWALPSAVRAIVKGLRGLYLLVMNRVRGVGA